MAAKTKNLLEALVLKGKITPAQRTAIEDIARRSGELPERILVADKLVSEPELYDIKSEITGIPFMDLSERVVDLDILQIMSEDAVLRYKIVPLGEEGGMFEVGMLDPEDIEGQEAAKFIAIQKHLEPKIYLISQSGFERIIKQYRGIKREVKTALKELESELGKKRRRKPLVSERETEREVERIVGEAPITKVVAVILRHAVEGRASDVHIEAVEGQLKVRFRVDGVLYTSLLLPGDVHGAITSRVKILSSLKIDETRIPQDGRFRTKIEGRNIDFRVSTFPTVNGEKVVMRVLDPSAGVFDLPKLGIDGRNLALVYTHVKKSFGMILLTGPTGSGKTTTQYAMLQILNSEGVNIVSLEDPVEYYIGGVNQSQVRPEIGYDFAEGLRHMVRQDPDIIMVGEIRDKETAALAVHAALTGHIVLSTLHTNNAIGIFPRLIDMGIQPFLIPSSVNLGIAQRLVRKLCEVCKKKIKASGQSRDIILGEMEKLPDEYKEKYFPKRGEILEIYYAPGCRECLNKGMSGRLGIFETLEMTPQLGEIILKKPNEADIEREAARQGMITLKQDGILKVLRGLTTLEEVLRVAE